MSIQERDDMGITRKDKWALFNHLRPGYGWSLLAFGLIAYNLRVGYVYHSDFSFFSLGFVFAYIILILQGTKFCQLLWVFFSYSKRGDLAALIHDFYEGEMIGCDQIRMGDNYIIGHRVVFPLQYHEITEIQDLVTRNKGAVVVHELLAYTTSSTRTLCHHAMDELSKEELTQIFEIIKSKNPNVRWGRTLSF